LAAARDRRTGGAQPKPSDIVSEAAAADEFQSQAKPKRTGPKVGRNDPCPCGSGKKYKNCCGRYVVSRCGALIFFPNIKLAACFGLLLNCK
jgi:hypothetical protein